MQGAGGALVAPAALSLITTTFPEGAPRTRAFGVYAAMSIAGGAIGLIGGGLLTTYASWRWVMFVNVPIGAAVALAAPRVLAETPRGHGRFDLPGAVTGTAGIAALVYGLVSAATSPSGVSHWGDAKVVASLVSAVVLLAAFAVIETRSAQSLLPLRLLRDRNRTGAYLSYGGVGIFIFGMFFFLTVFMQTVWGYSAIKTGVAYLPFTGALFIGAGTVTQLVPRIGARPLLLTGSALSTAGLYWLSAEPRRRSRLRSGLQPAQHRPASRRRHRAGSARHRRLDRGCSQGRPRDRRRRAGRTPGAPGRPASRGDLPSCHCHRLLPRLPGRRRDRPAHPGHQHHRDPGPPRRPRRR